MIFMDRSLSWIVHVCTVPVVQQGAWITLPVVVSGVVVRLCVLLSLPPGFVHTLCIALGLVVLLFFYSMGIVYFIALCAIVYVILLTVRRHRGVVVAAASLLFLFVCEVFIASAVEWHQVRGSFLVMVMRMVSLGFDLDSVIAKDKEKKPPRVARLPSLMEYGSYCLFPTTSVFGPFLVYEDHIKFLEPSSLSVGWLYAVCKAWIGCILCLAISSCFMPFLFPEPNYNKWLTAYSAAASFRYSHYFISLLSQCGTVIAGIGRTSTDNWSEFQVVKPLDIEIPRSLGTVVTSWNLPMHVFLKNYVYKPSRGYVGRFGAILLTYFASSLLHGLNFQLSAVLLSIGVYAYIENVLRTKLSARLNACVLDRPCPRECSHLYKESTVMVFVINLAFTALAMFHLAYLGLMFGSQSPEEMELQAQGFSMAHTLMKWAHLNFLSHWVALVSYLISVVL